MFVFLLAHRARLPDTEDFVLSELFSIFAYICAQRSAGRIPTFDFRDKKLKILLFMVTNVGKDGTFPAYSCFSTMDSFRFEEIMSGNGACQEI